ncbi:hypothetical protein [Tersicoccus solisilvae]|nr:hypothetical protein [Tersicoccus solisilvae]
MTPSNPPPPTFLRPHSATPQRPTFADQWRPMLAIGADIALTALPFSTSMTTFLGQVVKLDLSAVLLSKVVARAARRGTPPATGTPRQQSRPADHGCPSSDGARGPRRVTGEFPQQADISVR